MAHEVIMPALGMAQESGVIVNWLKAPGDAVKTGDALMEVETDKAVMEVEAQADGFLTDVRAAKGSDVPVGQVIALISETADGAGGEAAPAAPETPPEPAPEPLPEAQRPQAAQAPQSTSDSVTGNANGRVLASPKARRLANEQGLDLRRLAEAGKTQPYRAADIDSLKALGATPAGAPATATARANLPDTSYQRFVELVAAESDVTSGTVIAAFAAGALRASTGQAHVLVRVITPRLLDATFADPDKARLSDLAPEAAATKPDLIVFDLTQSRVCHVDPAASQAPIVSVAHDQDRVVIAISAMPAQLSDDRLIACLDDLAGRFEDPLRHLL